MVAIKESAHAKVSKAIKDGLMEKKPCSVCGNPKSEAHHEDYERPYDVIWFCKRHHEEHHHPEKKREPAKGTRQTVLIKPPQWVQDIKSTLPERRFSPFLYAAIRYFMNLPEEERLKLTESEYRWHKE